MRSERDHNSGEWAKKLRHLYPLEVRWNSRKSTFVQFGILNDRGIYASEHGDFLYHYIRDDDRSSWIICAAEEFEGYITENSEPRIKAFADSSEYLPVKIKKWYNRAKKILNKLKICNLTKYTYNTMIVSGSRAKVRNGRYFQCCRNIFWNGTLYLWKPLDEQEWYISGMNDLLSGNSEKCVAHQRESNRWYERNENNKLVIAHKFSVEEMSGIKGDG